MRWAGASPTASPGRARWAPPSPPPARGGAPAPRVPAPPPALTLPLLVGARLLPAAVGFGTVSPILIRLSIRSIGTSGDVVGRIYAAQAMGSIAGDRKSTR